MSIVKRANSPYWYLRVEQANGKPTMISTKIAIGASARESKASKRLAEAYETTWLAGERGRVDKSILLYDALEMFYQNKARGQRNLHTYIRKLRGLRKERKRGGREIGCWAMENKRLDKLEVRDLVNLIEARRGEGVGNLSIIYEFHCIRALLEYCGDKGYLVPGPGLNLTKIRIKHGVVPEAKEVDYLTEEEQARLLEACDLETREFLVILFSTACRHGEIAAAKWQDWNEERGTLRIYASKTKEEDTLHLSRKAQDVLRARRERSAGSEMYVFAAKDGGPRKKTYTAIKTAAAKAGVAMSWHKSRRTTLTRMAQSGKFSSSDVQAQARHKNPLTTMRYVKLMPTETSRKLAGWMDESDYETDTKKMKNNQKR